jgi:hypothetical protein
MKNATVAFFSSISHCKYRIYNSIMIHLRKIISTRLIKEYREFINWTSRSGATRTGDVIHTDEPKSAKSPSSGILLRDELLRKESKDFMKELIQNPYTTYTKNKTQEDIKQLYINQLFLENQDEPLRCEYCGKGPLVIYKVSNEELEKMLIDITYQPTKFKKYNGATVDHKVPRSSGGEKYDTTNMAVACYSCNQRKGNMDYDEWLEILKKR